MKNLLTIFISLVLLINLSYAVDRRKPHNKFAVKNVVQNIGKEDLQKLLARFILSSRPNRFPGSPGHQASIKFILDEIEKYKSFTQFKLETQTFKADLEYAKNLYQKDFDEKIVGKYTANDPVYMKWEKFTRDIIKKISGLGELTGTNIVLKIQGESDEAPLILGANFDTVLNNKEGELIVDGNMPGADDNGTGVVALLSMLPGLTKVDLKRSVYFVFFDFQELGALGSKAFVEAYIQNSSPKLAPCAFWNLLMLGNDTSVFDAAKESNNFKCYMRGPTHGGQVDRALFDAIEPIGHFTAGTKLFAPLQNDFDMGDHIHFWKASIPALVFTQDWENDLNRHQHTSQDIPEGINYTSYLNSVRFIFASLLAHNFQLEK